MTENIYYDSGYPDHGPYYDYDSNEELPYDMDLDLTTINERIKYRKAVEPYYDPEHARKRKAKFYKYQRYEREV